MSRVAAALTALALLVATAGCAALQAKRARTQRLQGELDALRYSQPLEQVWDEARRLLAERGYQLANEDAAAIGQPEMGIAERVFSPAKGTRQLSEANGLLRMMGIGSASDRVRGLGLDTGWGKESPRERRRLEAVTDDAEVRVTIARIVEDVTTSTESSARDLELELALARRLDPSAADRIEASTSSR